MGVSVWRCVWVHNFSTYSHRKDVLLCPLASQLEDERLGGVGRRPGNDYFEAVPLHPLDCLVDGLRCALFTAALCAPSRIWIASHGDDQVTLRLLAMCPGLLLKCLHGAI